MPLFTATGEATTNDKAALLSTLMEWTTEEDVLLAMITTRHADAVGLGQLAHHVQATVADMERSKLVDGDERPFDPLSTDAEPMDERMVAQSLLAFITAEAELPRGELRVIDVLARYISKVYRRREELARKDLLALRTELRTRYSIKYQEIPKFRAVSEDEAEVMRRTQDARKLGEQLFRNEALRICDPMECDCARNSCPYVALKDTYELSDEWIGPDLEAMLRQLPPELASIAVRFPPNCLVRSEGDIVCPAPGYLAVVSGYGYDPDGLERVPIVLVAGSDDPLAPIAHAHPDWLIRVACRGRVTPEAVLAIVEAVH